MSELDPTNDKQENILNSSGSRIPSPSSLSSANSVRPLEWDSGADVGYQCTSNTGLSTVERIALARRSGSLFFCNKENGGDSPYNITSHQGDSPLAGSTPLSCIETAKDVQTSNDEFPSYESNNPLPIGSYVLDSNSYAIEVEKTKKLSKLFANESKCYKLIPEDRCKNDSLGYKNLLKYGLTLTRPFVSRNLSKFPIRLSRSLNDVSNVEYTGTSRKNRKFLHRNKLIKLIKNPILQRKDFASSSTSTIVAKKLPQMNVTDSLYCKDIKGDSTVLHENTLSSNNSEDQIPKNINNENSYTLSYSWGNKIGQRLIENENHSSSESVDKVHSFEYFSGSESFKYVSGSAYECKTTSASIATLNDIETDGCFNVDPESSCSDVNTLNSKVQSTVDLITNYIDNLNISNKQKIIKKVAEVLIRGNYNKANEGIEKEASVQCTLSDNISKMSLGSVQEENAPICEEKANSDSILLGTLNHSVSGNLKKGSNSSVMLPKSRSNSSSATDYCGSSSISKRSDKSSIENKYTTEATCESNSVIGENIRKLSSDGDHTVSLDTRTYGELTQYSSIGPKKRTRIDNVNKLKRYLEKEREMQLMWIKSGITHLSNLKKLYENQKILQNEIMLCRNKGTNTGEDIQLTENISTDDKNSRTDHNRKTAIGSSPCLSYGTRTIDYYVRHNRKQQTNTKTEKKTKRKCLLAKDTCLPKTNSFGKQKDATSISVNGIRYVQSNGRIIMKQGSLEKHLDKRTSNVCNNESNRSNKENVSNNGKLVSDNGKQSIDNNDIHSSICSHYLKTISDNHRKYFQNNQSCRSTISYTITFQNKHQTEKPKNMVNKGKVKSKGKESHVVTNMEKFANAITLQDYLMQNRPDYIHHAESRRQCLKEISYLRKIRSQMKKELISSATNNLSERFSDYKIPPPPLAVRRIFDQKYLRQQTEEKYRKLSEVVNKKMEIEKKQNYQTNRLMAKVFTKKLQRKVLRGQINLSNSVSVILG